MLSFIQVLGIFCISLILFVGKAFIAPVFAGLIIASGLHPFLEKYPFRSIRSPKLRALTFLILFLSTACALGTYVIIGSAQGIYKNVDLHKNKADLDAPLFAVPTESVEAAPVIVQENAEKEVVDGSFSAKVKGWMGKIPGMNPEEIARTWSEIFSKARGLALLFLSKVLTVGPAFFMEWIVFLISFVSFFWGYSNVMFFLRSFDAKWSNVKESVNFFESATQATLLGTLVAGFSQASVIGIGTGIAGFDSFILLGFAAFFASFVPFVGTALVWVSVLIYTLVVGNTHAAIIVLVTGTISSMVDNLILPTFVGSKNSVHPLMLFIVFIGFVDLVGIWGIFIGPVMAIFTMRVLELWLKREHISA